MKAVLIFDNLNDLLFSKWDDTFIDRMKAFSQQQTEVRVSDSNNVSQLLSPLITSQRVMAAQFGNTYSSMQCVDGTTIVFDEWLDHVFMIISEEEVDESHRELLDCKTLVQHICGQNINLLHSPTYQSWLSALLSARTLGDSVPGAHGVIGQSGATAAALTALRDASRGVRCGGHQHYHMLLFVGDKLLALYSSRGSEDLTPPDIMLACIQSVAAQEHWRQAEKSDKSENSQIPWLSTENSAIVQLCAGAGSPCAPHSLHIAAAAPRLLVLLLVDLDTRELGTATQMSSQLLSNLRRLLLQRNLDVLPTTLDSLEAALKKTTEALRKQKGTTATNLCARLRTRSAELRRACASTAPLAPDTCAAALHTAIEAVVEYLRPDIPSCNMEPPLTELRGALAPYVDFLRVKAERYFGLGSYMEEFPGLVHFVYVDRTRGRALAPDMADATELITAETVRRTLARTAQLFRSGYTAATWRSGALHTCSILWWERGGAPVVPRTLHPAAVAALPPPGDILGSFYRQLAEQAFPNDTHNITVKELICMHLGLLPTATAVQQARRLAHTVHEQVGEMARPRAHDLL